MREKRLVASGRNFLRLGRKNPGYDPVVLAVCNGYFLMMPQQADV